MSRDKMAISPHTAHTETIISQTESDLFEKYRDKFQEALHLNRSMVSFQANKRLPFYRWLKYKEAFSAELVGEIIDRLEPPPGKPKLLDPFAGIGTALFASAQNGWSADGIEILKPAVFAIETKKRALWVDTEKFDRTVSQLCDMDFAKRCPIEIENSPFRAVPITCGAFPEETEHQILGFQNFCETEIDDDNIRALLLLACLSILEDVSYTRKDGQYLRWDKRAIRPKQNPRPSKFTKTVVPFHEALLQKLTEMSDDISSIVLEKLRTNIADHHVHIYDDSCFHTLPRLKHETYDLILTSPPYCNRYDYTRTYALELVFLGCDDRDIRRLRQQLISATVENKAKTQLEEEYRDMGQGDAHQKAIRSFEEQKHLQALLDALNEDANEARLNNPNIPQMVRNYFLEMSVIIHQLARVLKRGSKLVMVNDNVKYGNHEIPVDLILSELALSAGLNVETIWTLSSDKGNSSQQMDKYGRVALRKCVYVWERPRNEKIS